MTSCLSAAVFISIDRSVSLLLSLLQLSMLQFAVVTILVTLVVSFTVVTTPALPSSLSQAKIHVLTDDECTRDTASSRANTPLAL